MDCRSCRLPEPGSILETGIRVLTHEGTSKESILGVAKAIERVARQYAA